MYEFLLYHVKDVMTSSPLTTTPDTPLKEVERIFEEHDFNGIPVVDEQGRLAGMLTKFDFLKAFVLTPDTIAPHYDTLMAEPVKTVMTREPVTVEPDLPLTRVLQKLVEMRTKSFPVVEGDRLVGIIAREDVVRALRRATEHQLPPSQDARP